MRNEMAAVDWCFVAARGHGEPTLVGGIASLYDGGGQRPRGDRPVLPRQVFRAGKVEQVTGARLLELHQCAFVLPARIIIGDDV